MKKENNISNVLNMKMSNNWMYHLYNRTSHVKIMTHNIYVKCYLGFNDSYIISPYDSSLTALFCFLACKYGLPTDRYCDRYRVPNNHTF